MLGRPHRLETALLQCPGEIYCGDRVIGVEHRDAEMHFPSPCHVVSLGNQAISNSTNVATASVAVETDPVSRRAADAAGWIGTKRLQVSSEAQLPPPFE